MKKDERFPALRSTASFYKGIATLIIVIVFIGGGIGTFMAMAESSGSIFMAVVTACIGGLAAAGSLKLTAELISLALAIEENTRSQR